MRKHGSVRFDPYYKVQWFDPRSITWRDVQKAYPTPEAAQAAFLTEKKCRVMHITMKGRSPLTLTH